MIDRCGKHFGIILNFLRDNGTTLPETRRELLDLQQEVKYYLVQPLLEQIDKQVRSTYGNTGPSPFPDFVI